MRSLEHQGNSLRCSWVPVPASASSASWACFASALLSLLPPLASKKVVAKNVILVAVAALAGPVK